MKSKHRAQRDLHRIIRASKAAMRYAAPQLERLESRQLLAFGPVGDPFLVNTYTTNSQNNAAIAMRPTGEFVIVWQSSGQTSPADANLGIFAQRFDANGSPVGSEIHVNTYTTGNQQNPAVAMDSNGNFVVVWDSVGNTGGDADNAGIYGQRFSSAGAPVGTEFLVNTYTTSIQEQPSVAMDSDGDFVVAWHSYLQDGSSFGVYAQRYNADGTPAGGELHISEATVSAQRNASVSMDSNGSFVVAWASNDQEGTGSNFDIWARQYSSGGSPSGSEFRVNNTTTAAQNAPSVAVQANGDFVISWESVAEDGDSYGIYARRYSASGTPKADAFKVNTFTTDRQRNPSVAVDSTGDFVVTWSSRNQDGSVYGVYGQRYSPAGAPVDGEFRVNVYTTGQQLAPAVAMRSDGGFVVAFQSASQSPDGSGDGVFARRYADTGTPPNITSSSFVWQNAPQRIVIDFDQNVSGSLGPADLLLENLTTSSTIATADIQLLSYNIVNDTAEFVFPNFLGDALPNGKYRATILAAGVSGPSGTPMTANYVFEFFFVNGDANHDGAVDVTDLAAMATNWQSAVTTYQQGDFDYSGFVDVTDLAMLATNWQYVLPPPLPAPPTLTITKVATRPAPLRQPQRVESASRTVDTAIGG